MTNQDVKFVYMEIKIDIIYFLPLPYLYAAFLLQYRTHSGLQALNS